MKKLFTAIAFSVLTATAITAAAQSPDCGVGRGLSPCYQQGPGAGYGPGRQGGQVSVEDRIDRRVGRLTARLNLSNEQQAQVRTILQEQAGKGAASWEETHNRIAGVLNDEQRAQFEQWRAQRGGGGRGMGRGPGYGSGAGYGQGPGVGPQN
jgi:hypothetical protein